MDAVALQCSLRISIHIYVLKNSYLSSITTGSHKCCIRLISFIVQVSTHVVSTRQRVTAMTWYVGSFTTCYVIRDYYH